MTSEAYILLRSMVALKPHFHFLPLGPQGLAPALFPDQVSNYKPKVPWHPLVPGIWTLTAHWGMPPRQHSLSSIPICFPSHPSTPIGKAYICHIYYLSPVDHEPH